MTFEIAGHRIGDGHPVFVIAEAGVNHNGSVEMAKRLIDVAAEARANAVKFQTFRAESLATDEAPKAEYQKRTTGAGESQLAMLRRLQLGFDQFRKLAEYAAARGVLFLSTPFDEESADFLDSIGMPAFKVASGEITNLLLLEHIARKRKPVIISTGMATLGEVEAALAITRAAGARDIAILHCVSNYPANAGDVNLRAMDTMKRAFALPVGYSDHTMGIDISLAAVALGACVIEKHFTLDRTLSGPDHAASLEPAELRAMISGIRSVESALGNGIKRPASSEAATAVVARRSLVAARDISEGETVTAEMITLRRPGTGLMPALRPYVIGRVARVPVRRGQLLSLDMFA